MRVGFVLILVFLICNVSHSQAPSRQSGVSAQGSLTVTAIVEPSVWLVMEPDGKSNVVVANAPDPKQSFSHALVSKPGRKSAALVKAKHTRGDFVSVREANC
jgi:hypothetical protein